MGDSLDRAGLITEGEESADLKDRSGEVVYSTNLGDRRVVVVYGASIKLFLENGGHPVFKVVVVNDRKPAVNNSYHTFEREIPAKYITAYWSTEVGETKVGLRNTQRGLGRQNARWHLDIPSDILDTIDEIGAEFARKHKSQLELKRKVHDAVTEVVSET